METWGIVLIVIILICLLYLLLCFAILFLVCKKLFWVRGTDPDNPCYLRFEDYPFLKREEYVCGYYGKAIRGYLYSDKNVINPKGFIILSHGFFGTHVQYLLDISMLAKAGYLVLAYDQYGCGLSDGKNQDNLSVAIFVLENVIHDVNKRHLNNDLPIYLYGHSWGGYAVSGALKNYGDIVKKAVVRSGFVSPVKAGLNLLKMKFPKFSIFISPGIYISYFFFFGTKGFTKGTSGLKKNHKTEVLYIYAKNDKMIDNKNSLTTYYARHHHKNAELFVTETGAHNSLLLEEGQENYHKLVNTYKNIQQESDEVLRKKKEDDFLLNLNRVQQYPYCDEVKNEVLSFLDD